MKVYQDESGRLITIGQLYDEFQELRAIDPETYDYEFERYIEHCTSADGALTEVSAKWYSFETMWSDVKTKLRNFLQTAGITYELSGDANQMFSHFEILATEQIARRINEFLEEVTV